MSTDILAPENALLVIRGTSKTLKLSVVDDNGKPVDLTSAQIYMTVKQALGDVQNVFQKSTASSSQILITDPRGGTANIFLLPGDTQRLDIKPFVFDVWVILASGKRYAVVPPSVFEVQAGVTYLP